MNKYQELIKLIKDNNLIIKKESTYDAQSGWNGTHYYVYDAETLITDIAGNGFCFNDRSVEQSINAIKEYLAVENVKTIDAFRIWADDFAGEEMKK